MIPQPNQYVILVLRDSHIRLDGNVVSWNNEIVLKSKTNSITTVAYTSDVLYYQVIETETKYEEVKAKPIKGPEEIVELAKLKAELNLLEREEISRKFSTHEISGSPRLSNYELPNFTNITIPVKHPAKEVRREHTSADESLQGLFRKK